VPGASGECARLSCARKGEPQGMAEDYPYHCPFCDRDTTVTKERVSVETHVLYIDNAVGDHALVSRFIVCPNSQCRKYALVAALHKAGLDQGNWTAVGAPIKRWQLVPPSRAMAVPTYVPQQIRDDYEEACLIVSQSPKASATIARRCLQGMIRDYWAISMRRLIDEIAALAGKVDGATWEAIDSLRKVGNIGAHMEADVNVIVDVDPGEADSLIWLIELLIKDWYVVRHDRQLRLAEVKRIADAKAEAKRVLGTPTA
jgi:hypothetical protein